MGDEKILEVALRSKKPITQPLGPVIHEVWGGKNHTSFERALAKTVSLSISLISL